MLSLLLNVYLWVERPIELGDLHHPKEIVQKEKIYRKKKYEELKEQGYKRIRTQEYLEWEREYTKKRYSTPKGAIEHRLRARISSLVRNAKFRKSKKSLEYIGCSSEDFIKYIESLFLEGMTWENKRDWHIDHIIPCCSFDLSNEEEALTCFHYSNMRPLWAKDNFAKIKEDLKLKTNG